MHNVSHVLFRFTNNVLSTAQQVWLRKLGGAKPVVNENTNRIITAGRAKRSASQPVQPGDRFRQLKEDKNLDPGSGLDEELDDEAKDKGEEVLEEAYASSVGKQVPNISRSKRSKRTKKKRAV
uniref:Inner membrane protein ALBINO3 n=1 Tax=Rhizophora mucronata TaxID=61149 RepID=A0A2P2L2V1_RHIMU